MASFEHNKKEGKFFCKPTTKDLLLSLSSIPEWCRLLAQQTNEPFKDFLQGLIEKDFYNSDERLVIGKIAKDFKKDNAKLHKLLQQVYDAILFLNEEKPDLFRQPGVLHSLNFKYFDSHCYLYMWLPATPRIYETVVFDFVNGKVGTTHFTVTKVLHTLRENSTEISIYLEGGTVNPYRQWLIDRALFENKIGLFDVWNLKEHKLDEELKKIYR